MRRPDNKKDEQHFQTPPMASQKKRSHDFGPLCAPLQKLLARFTLEGQSQGQGTYVDKLALLGQGWPPCAGPTTKRTSNTSRPLQWHHKRRGAMTSGHFAAPFRSCWPEHPPGAQHKSTYVDKLPHTRGLATMRRPDNKKVEPPLCQTPTMASQKKRSHDFGPLCAPLGSCWLIHTRGAPHKVRTT